MFGGKEPAVVFGGIATLISLVIPALVLFNLIHWSKEQIAGFMGVVTFSANFLAVLLTRQQVVPTEVANAQIKVGIAGPSTNTVADVITQEKENRP